MKKALVPCLLVSLCLSAAPVARAEDAITAGIVRDILKGRDGIYSVSILDLETDDYTIINGGEEFHWASTVKLPLVLYTFLQVQEGKASLTDRVAYTKNDYEAGSGVLQRSVHVGDAFTIDYLTRLAIRQSDNIAKLMLLHHFGRPNIEAWAATLGGHFSADGLEAEEALIYLRYIYQHREEPLMKRLIDELNHTGKDRLGRFLPKDIVLAAKTGSLPGEFHNAGIIFAERPVAVSVYSKGTSEYTAEHIEGLIGKAVYDKYRERICPLLVFRGTQVVFTDSKPFLYHERTMVPLRAFAEFAGLSVEWDQATMTARLSGPQRSVTFAVGSDVAVASDSATPIALGEKVLLIGNTTYVPVRAISEAMGFKVSWDASTRTVIVE